MKLKKVIFWMLAAILLLPVITQNVDARNTVGFDVKTSPSTVKVGDLVEVSISLKGYTDQAAQADAIRGLQVDITGINPQVLYVESYASLIQDTTAISNTASYNEAGMRVRLAYVQFDDTLPAPCENVLKVVFRVDEDLTESGSITLPVTVKMQTVSQQITQTGEFTIHYTLNAVCEHVYQNGVCSICGDVLGTVAHKQWTMSLDSVAFLNYYVNLTGFAEDVDFKTQGGVVIWTGNVAPTKANQLQVGLENCKTIEGMFKNDNGWYVRSHEIFAKNLGDMVYMRPYVEVSEGVYVYGPAKGYSPHRYCLDMVGNENERLDTRRLCAALLEYGAAAQLYFNHNEDSLVNAGLNLQEQYGLTYDSSYLNGLNVTDHARSLVSTLDGVKKGVSYKKATLNLQGAIRMSVGYNIDASIIDWNQVEKAEVLFWTEDRIAGIDSLAYELHNYTYSHELRPKNAEDTVELGDYRSISDHIQAKDLGKTVYYCCRIVMEDGTVYRSGLNAYSPEAFLGDHLKTATGEIGDLCKKIAVYGEMARQRFS